MSTQATKSKTKQRLGLPGKDWDIDRLTVYVKKGLRLVRQNEAKFIKLGRASAVQLFRVGMALHRVRELTKPTHSWRNWQEQLGLSIGTVNEAIRLYERAGTEEAVRNLTITEAKERFEVIKKKAGEKAEDDGHAEAKQEASSSRPKRFVIPVPSQGKELQVLGKTLKVFEEILAAVSVVATFPDEKDAAELAALKTEFDRIVQVGSKLFDNGKPK